MKTLFLYLNAAMGDTLYLLSAARAIRKHTEKTKLIFLCPPHFIELARACIHFSEVWPTDSLTQTQQTQLHEALQQQRLVDFTHWSHAFAPRHMTDGFLAQIGLEVEPSEKQLDLNVPHQALDTVSLFYQQHNLHEKIVILMHPNVGHANRTWPQENWYALAEMCVQTGWEVVFIGSEHNSEAGKTMVSRVPEGVINAIDRFSPLETVALMRRANMLVSCDSGPVMLAAASDIPIVALYSTVAAADRLPYRHAEAGWRAKGVDLACSNGPCARYMANEAIFTAVFKRQFSAPTTQEFARWCLQEQPYHCLRRYTPAALYVEITALMLSVMS
ncbi:glycosyltransferase family 9 protein [Citrobacter portucalensis]|uniref:glycosyltransferase family 9 protein n=1 Tax=Citrobacter portucalensis TaxID=1639133 RepID=UPI003CF369D5